MREELDKINLAIQKYELKERKRKEQRKREKEKKKLEPLFRIESELLSERPKFYDNILEWRNEFIETEQFKGISNMGNMFKRITIFYGGWGHKIPYQKKYGCWSYLDLEDSGELIYVAGYKYMGIRERINLEDGVERFSSAYLKEIYDSIESGEVYSTIASKIERLSNLFDV